MRAFGQRSFGFVLASPITALLIPKGHSLIADRGGKGGKQSEELAFVCTSSSDRSSLTKKIGFRVFSRIHTSWVPVDESAATAHSRRWPHLKYCLHRKLHLVIFEAHLHISFCIMPPINEQILTAQQAQMEDYRRDIM